MMTLDWTRSELRKGLDCFDSGAFFEAHEHWELVWLDIRRTLAALPSRRFVFPSSKHIDKKELIAVSREAVQTAEDAREIAVKKLITEHHSNELQASAEAVDNATRQKEPAQAETAKAKSDME